MRLATALAAATATLVVVSCSSSAEPPSAPEDSVDRFFTAIFADDCERVQAELVAGRSKELTCEEVTKLGEYLGETQFEVGKAQVDGDNGTVTVDFTTEEFGDNTSTIDVVKQEGSWKVDPGAIEE